MKLKLFIIFISCAFLTVTPLFFPAMENGAITKMGSATIFFSVLFLLGSWMTLLRDEKERNGQDGKLASLQNSLNDIMGAIESNGMKYDEDKNEIILINKANTSQVGIHVGSAEISNIKGNKVTFVNKGNRKIDKR